jgi:hypothetical protein
MDKLLKMPQTVKKERAKKEVAQNASTLKISCREKNTKEAFFVRFLSGESILWDFWKFVEIVQCFAKTVMLFLWV